MENNQYIEFKKERELGEILSDTFAFLRNQLKPFLTTYFKIVGPYLIVMLIASAFYLYSIGSLINPDIQADGNVFGSFFTVISILIFIITALVVYALSQSTVLHYIKIVCSKIKNKIDFDEVKTEVYETLWSYIGLGFLVGLALAAGFMFCIIPGVYLFVPLSLSFSIMIFNQKTASDAFSDSFKLVKNHWWATFGSLIVVSIIVGIAGYAFSLPAAIYSLLETGIFSGQIDPATAGIVNSDPIYIVLNMVSTLASFLLNLISVIAGALIYFDLNEKKNFTGTYERIQNLGKTPEN